MSRTGWTTESRLVPLFRGDPAPFPGTLVDDETMRKLDNQMTAKGLCEAQWKSDPVPCVIVPPNPTAKILYFIGGAVVGGILIHALAP